MVDNGDTQELHVARVHRTTKLLWATGRSVGDCLITEFDERDRDGWMDGGWELVGLPTGRRSRPLGLMLLEI